MRIQYDKKAINEYLQTGLSLTEEESKDFMKIKKDLSPERVVEPSGVQCFEESKSF